MFQIKLILVVSLAFATSANGNWPGWRGPNQNGSVDAKNLPVRFSTKQNVKWAIDMPGDSAATPAIWEDRVFATAVKSDDNLVALCIDRNNGSTVWQHKVGKGPKTDRRSTKASPSPVTDGEIVLFFFGTGDLIAYTLDGKKLWNTNVQKTHGDFAFLWTFSTSPLLYKGRVYLQVLQRNEPVKGVGGTGDGKPIASFVLIFDAKSGGLIKKHVRPSKARIEALEAFSTPIVANVDGKDQIVVVGGDCLTGHDPGTFEEIWRWGTWNPKRTHHWRLVPSSVYGEGVFLACAPKGAPVYAIKAGGKGDMSKNKSAIAWVSTDKAISSDVCTPAFYRGRFYVLNGEKRKISCVDPATGNVTWTGDLPGRLYRASPTVTDGKIYCINHSGMVTVLEAGDTYKVLHQVQIGGDKDTLNRASIAVSHGNLFIRTNSRLYCIGK